MNETINLFKKEISNYINVKFAQNLTENDIIFDIPKNTANGDYSTNCALKFAKLLSMNPIQLANMLKEEVFSKNENVERIDIAGPGFINLFLKTEDLASCINKIINEDEKYGYNKSGNGEKILVEYVSANPTGDLHVGHAKAAAWGDSVTRLLKMSGYDCLREYYINDAGNQINNLADSIKARYLEALGLESSMPEDGYHGKDIIEIGKKLAKENGDTLVKMKDEEQHQYFRKIGLEIELEKIKNILKRFGVEFDVWSSEQAVRDSGKLDEVISILKEKDLIFEEDGATWFKSTKYGDDKDRVLIKKDGFYTYLTPDIAYHKTKLERGYTKLVDILGADHHGYIARMKAALMALGYSKDCLEIDIIQMIRLLENGVEVKMSKRTGKSVTLEELIDDIGVDATRYFLCSRASDTHLDFDLTLAKSQTSDNPVFYAQYAHARICSVLGAANDPTEKESYSLLKEQKEISLLKHINEFPKVVADAAKTRLPNKICNYIQKLSQLFHSYYGSYKINDAENPDLTNERLLLLKATKITLRNALNIIGVSAPERM